MLLYKYRNAVHILRRPCCFVFKELLSVNSDATCVWHSFSAVQGMIKLWHCSQISEGSRSD